MGSIKINKKLAVLRAKARRRKQIIKAGRMTSFKNPGMVSKLQRAKDTDTKL